MFIENENHLLTANVCSSSQGNRPGSSALVTEDQRHPVMTSQILLLASLN